MHYPSTEENSEKGEDCIPVFLEGKKQTVGLRKQNGSLESGEYHVYKMSF